MILTSVFFFLSLAFFVGAFISIIVAFSYIFSSVFYPLNKSVATANSLLVAAIVLSIIVLIIAVTTYIVNVVHDGFKNFRNITEYFNVDQVVTTRNSQTVFKIVMVIGSIVMLIVAVLALIAMILTYISGADPSLVSTYYSSMVAMILAFLAAICMSIAFIAFVYYARKTGVHELINATVSPTPPPMMTK